MGAAIGSSEATQHIPGVAAPAILEQLALILASPEFGVSERTKAFLRYVVTETLAGRGERIKAYAIAIEVFERDSAFDAQNDPVVRIEAGRLRRALERYYLVSGQNDPVRIDIPKGRYVPEFHWGSPSLPALGPRRGVAARARPWWRGWPARLSYGDILPGRELPLALLLLISLLVLSGTLWRWPAEPAAGSARPGTTGKLQASIIVLPFAEVTTSGQASSPATEVFSERIIAGLARMKDLQLLAQATSVYLNGRPTGGAGAKAAADYVLEGSVRRGNGTISVSIRLIDVHRGTYVWSSIYEERIDAAGSREAEQTIAQKLVSDLAEPLGALRQAREAAANG